MNRLFRCFLLGICLSLASCGGGGGGSATTSSTSAYDLSAACVNYAMTTGSASFRLSGSSSGIAVSGNGSFNTSALTGAVFRGTRSLMHTVTISGSLIINGSNTSLSVSDVTYIGSDDRLLGDDDSYVISWIPLPNGAKVGESGTFAVLYDMTYGYSVEADSIDTALLRVTGRSTSSSGVSTILARIKPDGSTTLSGQNEVSGTTNLTFTF